MRYEKNGRIFELLASELQGATLGDIDPDTIVVDTGNAGMDLGCYDHHSDTEYGSSAEKIYDNRQSVAGRVEAITGGASTAAVKIRMHREPDFDCIASAWLITEIAAYGPGEKLPEGTYTVIQYATFVDQGRLAMSWKNSRNPSAVLYAFYGTYGKDARDENGNDYVVRKGFQLMDSFREYAVRAKLDETLKGADRVEAAVILNDIAFSDDAFSEEYKIIDSDWSKYQEDKRRICKEYADFKVFSSRGCPSGCGKKGYCNECGGSRIEGCRALIWYKKPTCLFHKQWARLEGFVLTFIPDDPQNRGPDSSGGTFYEMPAGRYPLSKVILSVNPEYRYCLKNLAVILEIMECEKEAKLLAAPGEKRSRNRIRGGYEDEPWVTNIDPWYDGRSYRFTIVDAPHSGSLLSVDEILYAAEHYTRKCIHSVKLKVAYPFLYESIEKYRELSGQFENKFACITEKDKNGAFAGIFPEMKEDGYLRDHAKEYFSSCGREKNKGGNRYVSWYEAKGLIPGGGDGEAPARIALFHTGLGFVFRERNVAWFESDNSIDPERIVECMDRYREEGAELACSMPESAGARRRGKNGPAGSEPAGGLKFLSPVFQIYCSVNGTYFNYMGGAGKIAGAVLNNRNPSDLPGLEGQYLINGRNALIGLSQSCNVLVENGDAADTSAACGPGADGGKAGALRDRFLNEWYLEYLLALHQTEAMMNYRMLIGRSPENRNYREITYLREHLVDFMSRGYFTNVTSDTLGSSLYSKWQELLKTERIMAEVHEQIGALDDMANRKFQKNISVITFILLPVSIVLTVIQAACGIIGLSGFGPGILITLVICLAFSVPGLIYYVLSKDKEIGK